jgi:hypothetical protein
MGGGGEVEGDAGALGGLDGAHGVGDGGEAASEEPDAEGDVGEEVAGLEGLDLLVGAPREAVALEALGLGAPGEAEVSEAHEAEERDAAEGVGEGRDGAEAGLVGSLRRAGRGGQQGGRRRGRSGGGRAGGGGRGEGDGDLAVALPLADDHLLLLLLAVMLEAEGVGPRVDLKGAAIEALGEGLAVDQHAHRGGLPVSAVAPLDDYRGDGALDLLDPAGAVRREAPGADGSSADRHLLPGGQEATVAP